ncbi:diguanylate cyclase [Rhodanobacter sp. AS-Z3]|uniref:sensor domain-containing diguanylate cyclase n=1 Tax=Rhodanobacter sp. AS-Z3 TaxID=3031330 RepID=UPI002479C298|nr:diguanylate cyclase [Rhodanobacter sp. AS-Z3]WEN15055.1 diguanylate cyclase [Rhodanobacter sp. AS-Z3]
MSAPIPADEEQRLVRLRALAVLDTDAEPLFDALTAAAAQLTHSPIALLTLVDADRQWFKANVGLAGVSETPRTSAFCAHTILDANLLEVSDAQSDPRFVNNPLVTGAPYIRFYAGEPLQLVSGQRVGSLCVIDRQPRSLDDTQRSVLKSLAQAVVSGLELRMLAIEREEMLQREAELARQRENEASQLQRKLRASEDFLTRIGQLAGVGGWQMDLASKEIYWSDEICRIHDLPAGHRPTLQEAQSFCTPEVREVVNAAIDKCLQDGVGWNLELPLVTAAGRKIWVHTKGGVECDEQGQPLRLVGAIQDITARKRVTHALEASERRFRKLFEYSLGPICTHNHEGILLSVNQATADSLGYRVDELLRRPLTDFMRVEHHAAFQAYLLRMFRTNSDEGLLELVAKDGTLHVWHYQNVLDDEADEPYVLAHAQDVTDQHHQAQLLQEVSLRDPLTGCYNRRFLSETAARGMRGQWGCVAIDLDHFKAVNDTYGHQRGDEVLVAMAHFLSRHVRPEDAVIRLGGDEFLVLFRDASDGVAERVVERIERQRADAPISFTLGWSTFDQDTPLENGLAEADRRLYRQRALRGKSGRH